MFHIFSKGNKGELTLTRARRAPSSSSGFTLIELLTVISIIGVLTTVVTVNLAGARKQARDVRRKTDMQTIQSAVELYSNANSGKVPQGAAGLSCAGKAQACSAWIPGLDAYLSSVPTDPSNEAPFIYKYQTGTIPALTQSFAVDTVLETESPDNVTLKATTAGLQPSDPNYFVTGTYVENDGTTVHYRVSSGR